MKWNRNLKIHINFPLHIKKHWFNYSKKLRENEKLIEENNHKQTVINGLTENIPYTRNLTSLIVFAENHKADMLTDIMNYINVFVKIFMQI